MDYKEKYKAAIERAKEELGSGCFNKGSIEYIFPELKEDNDERIRKEIISALKWANHKGVYDKHIAWLEKQGNQMDIENAYKVGFKSGLKAKAILIPMVEWQSPCDQCDNPQMDCMNCPNHPVNRYETAYQKVLYQGNPTKENNWINQLYKKKEE